MATTVIHEENGHVESCGEPPAWTTAARERGELRSYFENEHREQWFVSASKERLRITGGDYSWGTKEIKSPDYRRLAEALLVSEYVGGLITPASLLLDGLVLNRSESAWLRGICRALEQR